MRTVGLFEAKQKLSELVAQAAAGETIGISRRGRLSAVLSPPQPGRDLAEIFASIERTRKRVKKVKGVTALSLIKEGRR